MTTAAVTDNLAIPLGHVWRRSYLAVSSRGCRHLFLVLVDMQGIMRIVVSIMGCGRLIVSNVYHISSKHLPAIVRPS